jgi:hypothetical protein
MNSHLPLSFFMVLITLTLVLLRWVHPRLPPLVQPSSLLTMEKVKMPQKGRIKFAAFDDKKRKPEPRLKGPAG